MNSAAYPKVPKNFALAMDSNLWANFVGTLLGASYVKAMPGESANPVQGVQLHDTVVRYEANPFWQWTGKVIGMDMDQLRLYTPNSAVVQTETGGAIAWRERFGKLQGKTGYYSAVDSLKLAVQVAHTGIRNTSFYMSGFDTTIDTN